MSKPLKTFLGVTVSRDEDIRNVTEVELERVVNAGIRLNIYGVNLIPVYEEHYVRIQYRYSLDEWDELPYLDKVMFVAMNRIENARRSVQSEAEIEDSERKAKSGRRR